MHVYANVCVCDVVLYDVVVWLHQCGLWCIMCHFFLCLFFSIVWTHANPTPHTTRQHTSTHHTSPLLFSFLPLPLLHPLLPRTLTPKRPATDGGAEPPTEVSIETDDGRSCVLPSVTGPNTRRRIAENTFLAENQTSSFAVAIITQEGNDGYRDKTMWIANVEQVELRGIMELSVSGRVFRWARHSKTIRWSIVEHNKWMELEESGPPHGCQAHAWKGPNQYCLVTIRKSENEVITMPHCRIWWRSPKTTLGNWVWSRTTGAWRNKLKMTLLRTSRLVVSKLKNSDEKMPIPRVPWWMESN